MKISRSKTTATAVSLFLMFAMAVSLVALPAATAQITGWKESYPYCVPIDDPVGVGQEILLWIGITDMVKWPTPGWEGLTVTVTKPDGTTETLGPFTTDTTGGTGTVYVPTMVGTYYFQTHFPEQVVKTERAGRTPPIGTVMKAADSEKVPVTVQEEPTPVWPGVPLPTEYWTRPINAQFREWSPIAGNYLRDALSLRIAPHSIFNPYNDAPETAHILWKKQVIMGGLAGGERGEHGYDDGTAYEGKWQGFIIGGILYVNVPWPGHAHYQGVRAIDLKTGEELWFKEGVRMSFGQLMYWDTQNMHAVFAYIWDAHDGTTWRAYDAYTGEWWFTLTDVPAGGAMYGGPSGNSTMMFGPKGELLIYTVDLANGWMTLWNSSNVPALYRDPNPYADDFPYHWGSWRPYGKTVNATGPFSVEPPTQTALPTGFAGYTWNKTIPKGLPGIVRKLRDGVILGTNIIEFNIATDPVYFWGISTEPGREGQLLFNKTYRVSGNITWEIRDASVEDGVFVVAAKETRQWYGFSTTTGDQLWGPTASQPWSDWVGFAQRNWVDVIADGKLYSGNYGGVIHCYDVKTGELLWTYAATDEYGESLMGPNWVMGIHFIADGKIYMGHFEHSSFDPLPRGSPTICIDAETGEEIWKIKIRTGNFMGAGDACLAIIGDGVMVIQNSYDMCDYAIGKGPSATTVTASPKVSVHGSSVLVEGMVTDISPGTEEYALRTRFPDGVPAVSDECMSDWMEYVYMQFPRPANATGVEVVIEVLDPNNNYYEVGRTTSDATGMFSYMFTPEVPGKYTIIATFAGSESYWPSFAETAIGVEEAPAATPAPTPTPAPMTDTYILGSTIGIIIAIAVAVLLLMLKKR